MADSTLNRFLARGTQAQRLAFTPSSPSPASGPSQGYRWFETDTGDGYDWNGTGWVRNRDAALWKNPVRAATTAALAANTYNNGTSGVGATLTGNANGALAAQDGVTLVAGDRLLVKNEATGANNGIYTVTQVGSAGTPYILTRATDADTSAELVSASVKISEGSTLADQEWQCTNDATITLGTTALVFAQVGSGGGSFTAASTTEVLTGTDTAKGATPDAIAALWEQGSDVASAATVSLGEGGYFNITGTTTITDIDFATDKAGRTAWVKFAGALTLTHNASTLILPGGANITTAAGDTACFISEGSDVVRCVAYQRASGASLAPYSGGVQSTPILAAAMTPRTTNGAASGSNETSTNKIMLATLDFDQSTEEYAQFMFPMPKSWNESTVTAQFIWTAASGTGDVIWGIQGVAISNDDALDAAFGTAQEVTDTLLATNDQHTTSFTSAMTIGGTPAEGDLVCFQVYRKAANGSDTLTADAKLIGIRLNFTTNAADDS